MKVFSWNKYLSNGWYANGVCMAFAPDLETAKNIILDTVRQATHEQYKFYKDIKEYSLMIDNKMHKVEYIISMEPEIFNGNFAYYQEQVD